METIIIKNISLPYKADPTEALRIARGRVEKYLGRGAAIKESINRRSVDARKKNDIRFIYSVAVQVEGIPNAQKLQKMDGALLEKAEPIPSQRGSEKLLAPPVIVGMGPCGMFAALVLAKAGYAPIVIERGKGIRERQKDVELFMNEGRLDIESNIQFGAGGAGTFSDGKLMTRINDPMCRFVLEQFVELGAPEEILVNAKPHIGTDNLVRVVDNAESMIRSLGGKVLYSTRFIETIEKDSRVVGIKTNNGDIPCGALILATGHSARDTYSYLIKEGFEVTAKDFSVGVRIEHLREDINKAMYGDADISLLSNAEYTLSHREGKRGVYTFCMCPGGTVIAAASEEGGVVVNGMSSYARDLENSNSAVAVSVLKEDYGSTPMGAIELQRRIERAAFTLGGGDYSVPVQTVGDFLASRSGSEPSRIKPSYMNGRAYKCADLTLGLPTHVSDMLRVGIRKFETKIKGFSVSDALLSGYETRTSAPVRINRGDELTVVGRDNLYPAGEGAGYAGGITSAAVDGVRIAHKIISRYAAVLE